MGRTQKKSIYWGAMVLDTFKYLTIIDHLDGNTLRVFFYLCYEMKKDDNVFYSKQVNIADNLKIHRSSVSKSIKKLIEKQYIVKIPGKGLMINPNLFYVNKAKFTERDHLRNIFYENVINPRFELNEDDSELLYLESEAETADFFD